MQSALRVLLSGLPLIGHNVALCALLRAAVCQLCHSICHALHFIAIAQHIHSRHSCGRLVVQNSSKTCRQKLQSGLDGC